VDGIKVGLIKITQERAERVDPSFEVNDQCSGAGHVNDQCSGAGRSRNNRRRQTRYPTAMIQWMEESLVDAETRSSHARSPTKSADILVMLTKIRKVSV
jgi:hypothetical protein